MSRGTEQMTQEMQTPSLVNAIFDLENSVSRRFFVDTRDKILTIQSEANRHSHQASTLDLLNGFGHSRPFFDLLSRAQFPHNALLQHLVEQPQVKVVTDSFLHRPEIMPTEGFMKTLSRALEYAVREGGLAEIDAMMHAITESEEVQEFLTPHEGASERLGDELKLYQSQIELKTKLRQLTDHKLPREDRLQMLEELQGVFATHPNPNS